MEQKTIWKAFLIIGINAYLFLTIYGCHKQVDPPLIKNFECVYKNNTSKDLILEIYNENDVMFRNYPIASNEELSINMESENSIDIFKFDNGIANKVIVHFSDDKCIDYLKSSNPVGKIFDITQYDNYSEDLVHQSTFTLNYSVNEIDYNNAMNCN